MSDSSARKRVSLPPGKPHLRSRHGARYDFDSLARACPELRAFIIPHPCDGDTIDFADANGVKVLNRALLKLHYGIAHWDIPPGYLCPPIPSRADYLHHVADLLASDAGGKIPRGLEVAIFDIGIGANCIYPLIGAGEYGWRFVGSDIDAKAITWARALITSNAAVAKTVICRLQTSPEHIFQGVLTDTERFDACICNPPFHRSAREAVAGTTRKLHNLGLSSGNEVRLNFGGRANELWCDGGEAGFIQRMIIQSAQRPHQCVWFTSLVSKRGSLPALYRSLEGVRAKDVRTLAMAQGQKQSRLIAWTFLSAQERSRESDGKLSPTNDRTTGLRMGKNARTGQ